MKKSTLLLCLFLFSFSGYSQFGPEGFENTAGPEPTPATNWTLGTGQWAVFDNGVGLDPRWDIINGTLAPLPAFVHGGTTAAFMTIGNNGPGQVSKDYLATPLFTIPTNGQLRFWTRMFTPGNQNTIFKVGIATATANQIDPAQYSFIQQWSEVQLQDIAPAVDTWIEKVVDIPATYPAGTQIYLVFSREYVQGATQTAIGGERWLIDDVKVVSRCLDMPLSSLTATNTSSTTASLNWANPSGATSWEIEIVGAAALPTGVGTVYNGTLPYIASGLTPNTNYKYYVRSICSNGALTNWIGPFNFTFLSVPPSSGTNIYNSDGSLNAARTVNLNNNYLTFKNDYNPPISGGNALSSITMSPFFSSSGGSLLNLNLNQPGISPDLNGSGFINFAASGSSGAKTTTLGVDDVSSWIQSSQRRTQDQFPLTLNPLGGYVGVGLGLSVAPTAQFHNKGTVRFEGLGTNFIDNDFLTSDSNGNITKRNLASLLAATSVNIYNSNGALSGTGSRVLDLNGKNMYFNSNISGISSSVRFSPSGAVSSPVLSIISNEPKVSPNLFGRGLLNYSIAGKGVTHGADDSASWMQSWYGPGKFKNVFSLSLNPLGGYVGVGLGSGIAPTAQFHNYGSLRFENLGSNNVDTDVLTSDINGNVTKRNINSLIVPPNNVNIYNSDGVIKENRFVTLKGNSLNFQDELITSILSPKNFYNGSDSFSSIKLTKEPVFQEPNLNGWGMFNINDNNKGNTLTQGIYSEATWIQSSRVGTKNIDIPVDPRNEGPVATIPVVLNDFDAQNLPLLLNPNKGNVGIGVYNPTAQLHTVDSVRFENLSGNNENTSVLTTDAAGNVTNRVLSNWDTTNVLTVSGNTLTSTVNGVSSTAILPAATSGSNTTGWLLTGNTLTTGNEFLGTTNNVPLTFKMNNTFSGRVGFQTLQGISPNQYPAGGTTSFGYGSSAVDAYNITAFGGYALNANTLGQDNSAFGAGTLMYNTTGTQNSAFGASALLSNTTGNFNHAFGYTALFSNTTGTSNIAIGRSALSANTTGSGNIALGFRTLLSNQEASGNIAIGNISLNSYVGPNNVDASNIAIGGGSGFGLVSGSANVFLGAQSGPQISSTGSGNLCFGYRAGSNLSTGSSNILFGAQSGAYITTGVNNIATGSEALKSNSSGDRNNVYGYLSLPQNTNGSSNNAFGSQALYRNTTGDNNTAFGDFAGYTLQSGNNNLFLGAGTSANVSTTGSNQINIGNAIFGYNGDIGIGVAIPQNKFEIASNSASASPSGLRFTNLPNTSPSVTNSTSKILSVNATGDVILVDDKGLTTTTNQLVYNNGSLTSTVNGVTSTAVLPVAPPTTNQLALAGNVLTSTVNGVTSNTVDLSGLTTPSVNIYNSSGTLLADRTVAMDNKTLNFNFGSSPSNLSPNTVSINPNTTTSSNLSVTIDRADIPNLFGNGHSKIEKSTSKLTTGYNQDYFWLQASTAQGEGQQTATNYMINPIGGKVAIGTTNINLDADCADCNDYRLFVKQGIRTEKVRVDIATVKGWADYVFEKEYKLMPLNELEKFIDTNKHLPTIPTATEVVKSGIDLGQMNSKLLEKVEELTLYTIDINKKNLELEKAKAEQDAIIQNLMERLEKLENKPKQ